jgi:hypothetical protein
VVGEVSAASRSRKLSVRPGRYFVRGRLPDALLEGEVNAVSGDLRVSDDALHRVAYARLVRKGGSEVTHAHGPVAGYTFRTALNNSSSLCQGAFAGYNVAYAQLGITPRLSACRSGFANATLSADVDELGFDVRLSHAWDLPVVTVDLGLAPGVSIFRQTFDSPGLARARLTAAPNIAAGVGLSADLGEGFSAMLESAAQTYVYRFEREDGTSRWTPSAALRVSAGFGKHW